MAGISSSSSGSGAGEGAALLSPTPETPAAEVGGGCADNDNDSETFSPLLDLLHEVSRDLHLRLRRQRRDPLAAARATRG
jgi:hypothetical protein